MVNKLIIIFTRECLRDRLLEDERRPLCLVHRDLPLDQDAHDCRDYLCLLEDTLAWSNETASCEFTVLFPAEVAGAVRRLVGQGDDS